MANHLLAWRVPGFGRLPADRSKRMAVVEIIGPGGMFGSECVSLGLILFGPKLDYPHHSHAAAELYMMLSGSMTWNINGIQHGMVTKGDYVFHQPWQTHAMSTDSGPALAFWGWSGDIRSETYAIAT